MKWTERYWRLRGQTSIEFLVLLAVAVFVLAVVALISRGQISSINVLKEQNDARNAVLDLSAAAKEVYSQGEGAKKQVYIVLPSGYDPTQSYVANKTIKVRARGTDFASAEDFEVHGSLPGTSGAHWVWVISENSKVRIGTAMLSLSKNSIYLVMNKNSSVTDSFSVASIWASNISVSIARVWTPTNVTMSASPLSFALGVEGSQQVDLVFVSTADAAGFYSGRLDITGNDSVNTETITLPITVEVIGSGTGIAPPLTITPSVWNETLLGGNNVTKEFVACTNSQTTLTGVTFATTAGPAGSWVGNLGNLGQMGPDTCLPKVFTLAVPNGTLSGLYTGTITGTGTGTSGAQDTIALSITVGGNLSDITGPRVLNVARIPVRPFINDPVTITALCDDTTTGNTTIKKGEISIDGGALATMLPADGTYNSPAENVAYTYYGLEFGRHNVTLRCTDNFNNIGTNVTYTFNIMKEMLIITKDLGASGSEQNWINWLNTHSSNESFGWNKDIVHRVSVVDAGFDLNRYAVIVLAEDGVTGGSTGSQLVTKLTNYIGSGGEILFLDEALKEPLEDMGFSTSHGDHTLLTTSVRDNTHYITANLPYPSNYTIYTSATKIYHAKGLSGTILTTDYDYGEHLTHPHLGYGSQFVIWGPSLPYRFSVNGNELSVRVVDYAITSSTVGSS